MSLGEADRGQVIALGPGVEADLGLQTIGPGHYGDPVVSSGAVTFLGATFPPDQNPGGPRQLFRFMAVAPGRADISIPHVGDLNGTPPFAFTLEVP